MDSLLLCNVSRESQISTRVQVHEEAEGGDKGEKLALSGENLVEGHDLWKVT